MKYTIDTTNKTIFLEEECTLEELNELFGGIEFKGYRFISKVKYCTTPYIPQPSNPDTTGTPWWEQPTIIF